MFCVCFFWVVLSLCIVCIYLSSVLYFPAWTKVNGIVVYVVYSLIVLMCRWESTHSLTRAVKWVVGVTWRLSSVRRMWRRSLTKIRRSVSSCLWTGPSSNHHATSGTCWSSSKFVWLSCRRHWQHHRQLRTMINMWYECARNLLPPCSMETRKPDKFYWQKV